MHFIKPFAGDFDVAHLHEHIDINRIYSALESKGLMTLLDFSVAADTYYSGHIVIRVWCAEPENYDIARDVLAEASWPTQQQIDNCLSQLACEDEEDYKVEGDLTKPLQKLINTKWRSENEAGLMITKDAAEDLDKPEQTGAIRFYEDRTAFTYVRLKLSLPRERYVKTPAKIALFDILSRTFGEGFSYYLRSQDIGTYDRKPTYDRSDQKVFQLHPVILFSTHITETELQEILRQYKKRWSRLVVQRAASWQALVKQDKELYHRVFDSLYEDYGLVISPEQLASVMTMETIQTILSEIECECLVSTTKDFTISLK